MQTKNPLRFLVFFCITLAVAVCFTPLARSKAALEDRIPGAIDNSRRVAVSWGDPNTMPGRQRLPSGEPRKASQRKSRPAAPVTVTVI